MELDENMQLMIESHIQPRMTDFTGLSYLVKGLINSPLSDDSIVVEIGTYHGVTAALMGRILKYLGKKNCILSIDPFEDYIPDKYNARGNYSEYKKTIDYYGVKDICFCLTGCSQRVASAVSDKITFLAIDGSHMYEDVLEDLSLFVPKVKKDGYIWLDDYNSEYYPGVVRAVDQMLGDCQNFDLVFQYPSFVLFKKLG